MKSKKPLMKKLSVKKFLVVAVLGASTLAVLASGTKSSWAGPGKGKAGAHGMEGRRKQRIERMAQELNLSAAQKAKLRPIMEDSHRQMMSIRKDTTLSVEVRMAKRRALQRSTRERIAAILTADQKRKFAAMKKAHHWNGADHKNKLPTKTANKKL